MTLHILEDEWAPVYSLYDRAPYKGCPSAEFSEAEISFIRRVEEEFHEVQGLLATRAGENYVCGCKLLNLVEIAQDSLKEQK